MADKKHKKGNTGKPSSFNKNLYEKTKVTPEEHAGSRKFAYVIYVICTIFFAFGTMIYYSQGNMAKMLIYLVLMVVCVYLIYRNRRKQSK